MAGLGLILLGTAFVGGIGALVRRRRASRLELRCESLRCPLHDCHADVSVRTDPHARSRQQYVDVAACSLLADSAIGLPERTGYLADAPQYKVRLEPAASHPVYVADVSCRQPCVFVLNETAVSAPSKPLTCASGASDGIDLVRQALGKPTSSQLLWYSSL